MERLTDVLAAVVARPLSDPFAPEWIGVSSPGMERWLSMQLCQRLGIWANPAFPFPRKLIEQLFAVVLGESSAETAYDPTTMALSLATLLREQEGRPELELVAHYLEGDELARRRVPLAGRLANLFDQYATYRPELVLGWERGKEAHFQALLLRALSQKHGSGHIAARAHAFVHALAQGDARRHALPERVSLFGVSTLPPLYLDVLSALGQHVEVHLFLLSPTREYYGDLTGRAPRAATPELDAQVTQPLLASLGRHGRELIDVLQERTSYQELAADLYEEPGQDTLLHRLQSDMLALRDRGGRAGDAPRVRLSETDHSIAIHACHGPMREVEVLHDQLLALFQDRALGPHDVIVMTPDIEAYAPMIDAVFSAGDERQRIPFRIADRGAQVSFDVVNALDAVLDVLSGRMGQSQVLDLLGIEPIRARFGITAHEVETARTLCIDSGVRWGIDADHRVSVGQPARDENTWRFGLSRLALGYALPALATGGDNGDDGGGLCLGRAPRTITADEADLFGRLSEFCATLFSQHTRFRTPCTLGEWQTRILAVLRDVIVSDARTEGEHKLCQRALDALADAARASGFDEAIELGTVRPLLAEALSARAPAQAFLSGAVTFCQLVPMRSIPFHTVCLIGMNDGAFPASDTPLSFDKMAEAPRPGDRSRRNDDRQLFLEAILSARHTLYVSYVGQSLRDGQPLLPSVLVTELVDQLACGSLLGDDASEPSAQKQARQMSERLTLRHPLTAFSPRYFGADADPRLFSYARSRFRGACALQREHTAPRGFFLGTQPTELEALPAASEVALDELEGFLERPLRTFIRRTLGVPLGEDAAAVSDREPFDLDNLAKWKVGAELLARARRGDADDAGFPLLRARGELPLGTPGKLDYDEISERARALTERARSYCGHEKLAPVSFQLSIAGTTLRCTLNDVWRDAHVRVQYSKLGRRHELRQWLRHLALSLLRLREPERGLPAVSILVGRGSKNNEEVAAVRFCDVADPEGQLAALLAFYHAGKRAPLPLFEHASRKYAEVLAKRSSPEAALSSAEDKFVLSLGSSFGMEHDQFDAYVSQAYPSWQAVRAQREPFDFEQLATAVYGAMLAHQVPA